ncbi:MAG: response regulator [Thermodesulfovibrionales bacterium]|nr:response regulator [Thermodesulfovibrionales bacterium]
MSDNKILIVDDEINVTEALKRIFIDEPYLIITSNSAQEGLKLLYKDKFKVVISDERMPEMSGSEFLSIVRKEFPHIIRIILTGYASLDSAVRAINNGEIYRYLTKPWEETQLRLIVRDAVDKFNLEEENRRLLETIKNQAITLKMIEQQYPGITKIDEDEKGSILLPSVSDEELQEIIEKYSNF